jgi:hypothetical protein
MSNIKEAPVWSDSVHLLSRQERVEGGAGGSANIQAQQLANRTAYLKEALESIPDYRQHTFYPSEGDPDGTIAGVAGTEDGDGFRVALFDAAGVTAAYNIYRNVSGAAQFITAEPNTRYIELISQRIPVSVRGRFYAAILGDDGTVCLGGRKSDGKTEISDGTVIEDALGALHVYHSTNEAVSKTADKMCFVYIDDKGEPHLYSNSGGVAEHVFSFITENKVSQRLKRSGYIAGTVGRNDELLTGTRKEDGAFVTYLSGNIDEKIKWLIENSNGHTSATESHTYADSKGAGTGGTPFPAQLAALIGGGFNAVNYGIGGQKSGQIAMRLGAQPTYVTVEGNAIPAANGSVVITQFNGASATAAPAYPSQDKRLLSTNSDNLTRSIDGWLCGVKCRITREASGLNNNTKVEKYTLTALSGTGVRCLPCSLFVPEYALQDHSGAELWICAGINDFRSGTDADLTDDVAQIIKNVDAMIAFAEKSGRKVLLFALTADNYSTEFYGGIRYMRILEINYYWSQKYPDYYVRADNGLDVRELLIAAYNANNAQDVIDYGNDITPSSLRSDDRHPNTAGYAIYANAGYQFRNRKGF